jgi:small subunit ribosomal protein S16
MSVVIRLSRTGAKSKPSYRVVVADSNSKRDGKCLERVGTFYPKAEKDGVKIDVERVNYWISVGAQPSSKVSSLLKLCK